MHRNIHLCIFAKKVFCFCENCTKNGILQFPENSECNDIFAKMSSSQGEDFGIGVRALVERYGIKCTEEFWEWLEHTVLRMKAIKLKATVELSFVVHPLSCYMMTEWGPNRFVWVLHNQTLYTSRHPNKSILPVLQR